MERDWGAALGSVPSVVWFAVGGFAVGFFMLGSILLAAGCAILGVMIAKGRFGKLL